MDPVQFVIGENNTYYKLEPGKALLGFTEFDFTFFWEQCIEAGKTAHKTGRIPSDTVNAAKSAVKKCHPYVEASINGQFDSIVTDCIIAYICSSEHIGLEELWARCISPKNHYESSLFRRISEYKTGRAINQWINIVRVNEYAKKKLDFIFDDKPESGVSDEMRRRRKEYFDLAFALAANELGYPIGEMPCIRKYSPPLAPEGAFRMGKLSHYVYHSISESLKGASHALSKHVEQSASDQAAMDAFSYIKDMPRPDTADMNRAALGAVSSNPVIYMPTGFKAMIDLEFDLLAENGEYIERCASCGRYFIHDNEYGRPYCTRVNSSGQTCRSVDEEEQRLKRETEEKLLAAKKQAEDKLLAEKMAFLKQREMEAFAIPEEVRKRGDELLEKLSEHAGKDLDKTEFEEWAKYLGNIKENITRGDDTVDQLEEFLGTGDKLYEDVMNGSYAEARKQEKERQEKLEKDKQEKEKQEKKKRRRRSASDDEPPIITAAYGTRRRKKTADKEVRYVPVSFDDYDNENGIIDTQPAEAPEVQSASEPEVRYTEDGRKYTPFIPKKYASLREAMSDPVYKKDSSSPVLGDIIGVTELAAMKKDSYQSLYESDSFEGTSSAKKNPPTRVIRKPDWEVLSSGKQGARK